MNKPIRDIPLLDAQAAMNHLLDTLCPMHLHVSETGHILHAGPTLHKVRPELAVGRQRFLEVFKLDRPRSTTNMGDLMRRAQTKLHLEFRNPPQTALKGVLVRLRPGQGAIINLSFGISVVEGVQAYNLTSADFAATDLAVEMLYLVEAKSAALEVLGKLNERLHGAKEAAEEQALTDTLTGLRNRRAAEAHLAQLIAEDRDFAVMQVDLDFFKAVNDTYGHAAGDHVLRKAAQAMQSETRDCDIIARMGGDEFLIIINELASVGDLREIAMRVISRLEVPIRYESELCRISASIGIAIHPSGADVSLDQLMGASDEALYQSKKDGRGRATVARQSEINDMRCREKEKAKPP